MTRVAIFGASGRMGQSLVRVASEHGCTVVAAVDRNAVGKDVGEVAGIGAIGVRIAAELDALRDADAIIEFSLPDAAASLFEAARGWGVPIVSGTTGLHERAGSLLDALCAEVAVVAAPNFSQGVTLLFHLAAEAAAKAGPGFDAEIVELHHRMKVDAPSGTAVRLAEVVREAKGITKTTTGRDGHVGARPDDEVAVLAVRGGDIVGEHTLYLAGMGERLELTHRARDRAIFARGAMRAATWVQGRTPGRYDMSDVMGLRA